MGFSPKGDPNLADGPCQPGKVLSEPSAARSQLGALPQGDGAMLEPQGAIFGKALG